MYKSGLYGKRYNIINFSETSLIKILEVNYFEIFEEMVKENYIFEYDNFLEFRELIYEGNVVGFLTLDTFLPTNFTLCLNECYILPKYRGKGILINIIKELLEDETLRFYVRKPNYSFVKFLIKHDLAFEVTSNIVSSHIKFVFTGDDVYSNKYINQLYRKKESNSKLVYYSAGFHMGLCSSFGVDPLMVSVKNLTDRIIFISS